MIESKEQYEQMMNRLFDLEILGQTECEEFQETLKNVVQFEKNDLLTPEERRKAGLDNE